MVNELKSRQTKWLTCQKMTVLPSPVVIGAAVAAVQHQKFDLLLDLAALQHQYFQFLNGKKICYPFCLQMKKILLIELHHQCENHNYRADSVNSER